jgi:phosphoribosylformylglycinamidine synthase
VSFYNETPKGSIKPTPLIGIIGLIENKPLIPKKIETDDCLIIIGNTKDELGGSEYYEYIHNFIGGNCPKVDFKESKKNMNAVLKIIKKGIIKSVHDCSKGGLGIAVSEICMYNQIGCNVLINQIPGEKLESDRILFSETHSRYLLAIEPKNIKEIEKILEKNKITYKIIGKFGGKKIQFSLREKSIIDLSVEKTYKIWSNSLRELVLHG